MNPTQNRIHVLPTTVAEKIAAGEVIERPFSVVKELVENSIDANATEIRIDLENGGLRTIQITDNGSGILPEDLPLALQRHGTSKIVNIDDLWNLHTMGFRGEALPSIAAISHLTVSTRIANMEINPNDRQMAWEGGILTSDQRVPAVASLPKPSGTKILVEHLFFNVPARLKFMKSKSAESSSIRELIERLSLSHPSIQFSIYNDGRRTLHLPATEMPEVRLAEVLDISASDLEPIEAHYHGISLNGFWDRSGRAQNSKQIYLSVNKRMLKDRQLMQTCSAALRPAMMEGQFPRLFLNITVNPQTLDVNVHPTKTEVRFQNSRDVLSFLHSTLYRIATAPTRFSYNVDLPRQVSTEEEESQLLNTRAPSQSTHFLEPTTSTPLLFGHSDELGVQYKTKAIYTPLFNEENNSPQQTTLANDSTDDKNTPLVHSSIHSVYDTNRTPQDTTLKSLKSLTDSSQGTSQGTSQESQQRAPATLSLPTESATALSTKSWSPSPKPALPSMHYIGQLKNTYLLFQDQEGMVLIDQHAAHERIHYERLRAQLTGATQSQEKIPSQPLLLAVTVKLKPEQVARALDELPFFESFGFQLEHFGSDAIIIREAPAHLAPERVAETFQALLAIQESSEDTDGALAASADIGGALPPKWERAIATAACHASVRAGQALSAEEAYALTRTMQITPAFLNCPHGRPASIRLSFSQIERLFMRTT